MTRIAASRRNLLATGACALVGAVSLPGPASASALGGQNLTNEEPGSGTRPGRRKTEAQWIACSPITSPLQARPATTTSARALSKHDAGKHRSISLDILTWSESPLARRMLL